jgi:hypothetical protein
MNSRLQELQEEAQRRIRKLAETARAKLLECYAKGRLDRFDLVGISDDEIETLIREEKENRWDD